MMKLAVKKIFESWPAFPFKQVVLALVCVTALALIFNQRVLFTAQASAPCDGIKRSLEQLQQERENINKELENARTPQEQTRLRRELKSINQRIIEKEKELNGCTSGPAADLIVVPLSGQSGPTSFCNRLNEDLIVTVKNQGTASAGSFMVKVDFNHGSGSVSANVPKLGRDQSVPVRIRIPQGCFSSDCGFVITLDPTGQITELNKNNNRASGTCVG